MQASSAEVAALIEGADVTLQARVNLNLPIWRTNLAPNPAFGCFSLTGYEPSPDTNMYGPTTDSEYPDPTLPMMQVESLNASTDTYVSVGGDAGGVRLGLRPGSTYTVSAERVAEWDVLVSECGPYVGQIVVMTRDQGDTVYRAHTSGDDSTLQTINGQQYRTWSPAIDTRRSVTFTVPSAAGECFIRLYAGVSNRASDNLPQRMSWTKVLIEEAPTAGDYFDGSSPGAEWTGQPLYSPSRMSIDPYPDVTLAVESVQLDRTLTTDAPKGTRLVSGYPTAQAVVGLSGLVDPTDETKTIAWLLDPANLDSPMARKQLENRATVTIDLGTPHDGTTDWTRIMTGHVDSFTFDRATGKVQLTVLDSRTKLRQVSNLPQITLNSYWAGQATCEYAIDQLLLNASGGKLSSRPPVRPQALVAVGLRGSPQPDVGHLSDTSGGGGVFTPMPTFGGTGLGAADPTATGWAMLYYDQLSIDADTLYFEALVENVPRDGVDTGKFEIIVDDGIAADSVAVWFEPTGVNVFTFFGVDGTYSEGGLSFGSDGVHGVLVDWPQGSTVMTVKAWNATGYQVLTVNQPHPRTQVWTRAGIGALGSMVGCSAQITLETDPVPSIGWVQRAFLDPSLNTIAVTPAITGDPFQTIQAICSAEQGVAGFDEYDTFYFHNRKTLAAAPLARTVSAKSSLRKFQTQRQAATQATRVTAAYTTWSYSQPQAVFKLASPLPPIDPGKSLTVTFTTATLVAEVPQFAEQTPSNGQSTNDGGNWIRWCNAADGSVDLLNDGVSIDAVQVAGNQIRVTLTNSGSSRVWVVSSNRYSDVKPGTPYLVIGGVTITSTAATADSQWPPVEDGGAVAGEDGEIALQLPASDWRQSQAATQAMTDDVLADTYKPREQFTSIEINPDQRLQLTDRVQWDAGPEQGTARIFGIHFQLSKTSASMLIDATAEAWSGSWLMGVAGRSEMGVATYV